MEVCVVDGPTKLGHTSDAERAGSMNLTSSLVGPDDEKIATGDAAALYSRRELAVGLSRPKELSLVDAVEAFEPVGMWTR